jgi:hypothetical protein
MTFDGAKHIAEVGTFRAGLLRVREGLNKPFSMRPERQLRSPGEPGLTIEDLSHEPRSRRRNSSYLRLG